MNLYPSLPRSAEELSLLSYLRTSACFLLSLISLLFWQRLIGEITADIKNSYLCSLQWLCCNNKNSLLCAQQGIIMFSLQSEGKHTI